MKEQNQQISDAELEQALGHFRQSVRAMSEQWSGAQGHAESRSIRRTAAVDRGASSRKLPDWLTWSIGFSAAGATVAVCALAAVLFTSGHKADHMPAPRNLAQTVVPAPHISVATQQHLRTVIEQPAEPPTAKRATLAPVSGPTTTADDPDAKLLAAIDSDISQGTPTALAPMANWMGDSANQ